MTKKEINAMTKKDILDALKATGASDETMKTLEQMPKKDLVDFIYQTMKKKEAKKEETMKQTEQKQTEQVEQKQTEQKQSRAEQKQNMIDRVDTWIENSNVEVKLYKNYPHVRDIKIEGKTVFQLWVSANGARMCTRTNLVPEADRPQGATIIKDGFDLSIPTFTDIEAELDKYLTICQRSLNQKAEAKKAKAEAKEAEKKAKKAEAEQKQ